jgi:cytochrome c553
LRIYDLLTQLATGVAFLGAMSNVSAQKNGNAPHIVTTYCSGCHEVDGNAQLPYVPKLAGINLAYAERKLTGFEEISPPVDEVFSGVLNLTDPKKEPTNVTRQERINMQGVAHAAKPEEMKEALLWYAKQTREPGRSGNKRLLAQGKELFLDGVPAQKVLSCQTCHARDAQGKGFAPRLAGQNAEYIEGQLAKFRQGDRRHAPEMTMVTRDLDPDQARAVAAYLQSQ